MWWKISLLIFAFVAAIAGIFALIGSLWGWIPYALLALAVVALLVGVISLLKERRGGSDADKPTLPEPTNASLDGEFGDIRIRGRFTSRADELARGKFGDFDVDEGGEVDHDPRR